MASTPRGASACPLLQQDYIDGLPTRLNSGFVSVSVRGASTSLSGAARLSATADIVSGASASLSDKIGLSATAAIVSGASASLFAKIGLRATADIVSGASASLSDTIGLNAAGAIVGGAAASLSDTIGLNATGTVVSGASAALDVAVALNATGPIVSGASASLSDAIGMRATAAIVSGASASLSDTIGLNATAATTSDASADLDVVHSAATTAAPPLTRVVQSSPGSTSGGGGGPMWITFEDQPAPRPSPILVTADGTEVYDRWSSDRMNSILSGVSAIALYKPQELQTRTRVQAKPTSIDMTAVAAIVTALAKQQTWISQSLQVLRVAQNKLDADRAALAQEKQQIAAARALMEAAIAVAPTEPLVDESFYVESMMLHGYDEPEPEPVVAMVAAPPPSWRAILAGICLVGTLAVIIALTVSLTTAAKPVSIKSRPRRSAAAPRRLAA